MTKRNAIIIAKNSAYLIQYFFNSTEKYPVVNIEIPNEQQLVLHFIYVIHTLTKINNGLWPLKSKI